MKPLTQNWRIMPVKTKPKKRKKFEIPLDEGTRKFAEKELHKARVRKTGVEFDDDLSLDDILELERKFKIKKKTEFKIVVARRDGITIYKDKHEDQEHLRFVESVKRAAGKIEFDCGFKGNLCVKNIETISDDKKIGLNPGNEKNGCCGHCASNVGYWKKIPESLVHTMAPFWNDKTGFLGPKGCTLPYGARSSTCVGFTCSCVRRKLKPLDKELLDAIHFVRN
jgi:hypothetical protein